MNLIATFNFEESKEKEYSEFKVRETVRAVIFDGDNNVALMKVGEDNFHKLPGGGVDEGETLDQALKRECLEEAGVVIKNTHEIGLIIEIKKESRSIQNSYCYLANVSGDKASSNLTEEEKSRGFKVLWMNVDEAIKCIKNDGFDNLQGRYIYKRELTILETVKKII
jgi:ADP-ribose pyrophosphatase YjhB (NUDIX family)